ncbi:MAG TPA: hypothetical protein VHB20_14630 [Verrucomicrobiae bacterium]|jgi:hypothetical protein|nr:hypothetical protein [Verrucomicrobiae bacterium]
MLTFTYNDHGTLERIHGLAAASRNPRQLMLGIGREVANQLKTHFRIKDANQPNKLGGPREHFWNQVGASVGNPAVDTSGLVVTVTVNDPRFAQKVFGGTITAKHAGALAIPQTADAYGRYPATFEAETGLKLQLVRLHDDKAVLATISENQGITVEYVLTPSVHQDPDPTALPLPELLEAAIVQRGEMIVERQNRDLGLT